MDPRRQLLDDLADVRTIGFVHHQLTAEPEIFYLRRAAGELMQNHKLHLRDIIDSLANSAFRNFNLSFREFIEHLKSSEIIDDFINQFLDDLRHTETDRLRSVSTSPCESDFSRVQNLVYTFLSQYSENSGETLFNFLNGLRTLFPLVDYSQVFDVDMLLYFRQQMIGSSEKIAQEKFEQIFRRDPDRLVVDFLLSRVISIDSQGIPTVNEGRLEELFDFASSPSGSNGDKRKPYDIEKTYLLLYERLFEMSQRIGSVRDSVRATIPDFLPGDTVHKNSIFHPDFNFHQFFEDTIEPVIAKTYEKHLPRGKPELIDGISTDPDVLLRAVMPERALEELKMIADLDPVQFGDFLRKHFNYTHIPGGVELNDPEIVEILSSQMTDVAKLVRYLSCEPVEIRPLDDPIRERCRFLPEIAGTDKHPENCADLYDLFKWSAYPERFFDDYPDKKEGDGAVSPERVRHEAHMMLQLLYFYRKHIFEDSFQESEKSQEILSEHLRKRLQMEVLDEGGTPFKFRIECELDSETREPKIGENGAMYTILYPQDSSEFYNDKDETLEFQKGKKLLRRHPVEEKRLTAVKVTIPVAGKEPVTGNVWIYTPDGEIIGRKTFESYLASILRGKTPTDLLRTTFIADDPKVLEALKQFLYESYCSDTRDIKIKDHGAGRSTNPVGSRTKGSKKFVADQALSAGGLYLTTILTDRNTVIDAFHSNDPTVRCASFLELLKSHSHIPFEVQIMGSVDKMLKTLSNYTDVSHGLYGPERFWMSRVFQRLFHPLIYGHAVARDLLGGCKGRSEELERIEEVAM